MNRTKFIGYTRYFLDKLKEDAVSAYAAQAAFFMTLNTCFYKRIKAKVTSRCPVE